MIIFTVAIVILTIVILAFASYAAIMCGRENGFWKGVGMFFLMLFIILITLSSLGVPYMITTWIGTLFY